MWERESDTFQPSLTQLWLPQGQHGGEWPSDDPGEEPLFRLTNPWLIASEFDRFLSKRVFVFVFYFLSFPPMLFYGFRDDRHNSHRSLEFFWSKKYAVENALFGSLFYLEPLFEGYQVLIYIYVIKVFVNRMILKYK